MVDNISERLKQGCGKVCMNKFSDPDFFKCGEKIKGEIVLCLNCEKLKK